MIYRTVLLSLLTLVILAPCYADEAVVARFLGSDFEGGAKDVYGSSHSGAWGVNYVYSQPTGDKSTMQAKFRIRELPSEPMFLHIKAMDDNFPEKSQIEIAVNDAVILSGTSPFPDDKWGWNKFSIPQNAMVKGENRLTIKNLAAEGKAGWPPWFMVAFVIIGSENVEHDSSLSMENDFRITLTEKKRPIPEPYGKDEEFSGFKWRGTKGWMWTPEQYLAEIPVLANAKMNFLMNCYASMCDLENYRWGDPKCNEWWKPLADEKREKYAKIVKACQEANIEFCFSMNPNLSSARYVSADEPQTIDDLYQHYDWMQGLGVKWFNLSLDDISQGIDAADQAAAVNEIFKRLKANDPDVQMIFTPTHYWGTGEDDPYLTTLADVLHKDVYIFWTGPIVVSQEIRKEQAESYKKAVGHRLFIWDNYPVNDGAPTLHLGPIIRRDSDLPEVCDGYMSNPLCPQSQINRIPLLTCADYAYNPKAYDPKRSIAQAILYNAENREQAETLKDLVELYPGMLIYHISGTGFNALQKRYNEILATPHSRYVSRSVLDFAQSVSDRMAKQFPDKFKAAQDTLNNDIKAMEENYSAKYGEAITN